MTEFDKPFGGAVSAYARDGAPEHVRAALARAGKDGILSDSYPYRTAMDEKTYDRAFHALQIELARMQAWMRASGARIVVLFEGRDAAGKGGTIRRFAENLNPRCARIVALPKPTETERTQWYFQRYIAHLPAAGEMVLFDRSWYNRATVEPVFGFCTPGERAAFFAQVPQVEALLQAEGIRLFKLWLTVGRAEQLRRFLDREADPLKQWKLSRIDVDGLARWDAYSDAIGEMFARTHLPASPWTVIRADDKRRARLAAIRTVLSPLPYTGKDHTALGAPDPAICGGPGIMPDENL